MNGGDATVRALVELQLRCLTPAPAALLDDPRAIADEALEYLKTVPDIIQKIFHQAADRIDAAARERYGRAFTELSLAEREAVLDDLWGDHQWHEHGLPLGE